MKSRVSVCKPEEIFENKLVTVFCVLACWNNRREVSNHNVQHTPKQRKGIVRYIYVYIYSKEIKGGKLSLSRNGLYKPSSRYCLKAALSSSIQNKVFFQYKF